MEKLYTPKELALARKLKKNGIVNPLWTIRAAKYAKLPLPIACALLQQETGGGHNVFGHDPTIFVGAGSVDEHKYKAYRERRGPNGRGGMQGVGPCQLTYWSYQDQADRLGGCWKPLANMKVGFNIMANLIRRYGYRAGFAAYNGTGPAAQAYARNLESLVAKWERILR